MNQVVSTEDTLNLIQEIIEDQQQLDIDISSVLDIAESLQNSQNLTKKSLGILRQYFSSKKSEIIYKALLVFEVLVKNCNENFHYFVNDEQFQKAFLKLLNLKRGKANLVDKMLAKQNIWKKIEEKVLYLYQLWADTFMMAEDQYPNIMRNYKILRKEGLQFPPRDPSEKYMIQFKGAKSPIFEVIDEVSKREQEERKKKEFYRTQYDQQMGKTQKKQQNIKSDQEFQTPSIHINEQEINNCKESIQLLLALIESAETSQELNSEFTAELLGQIREQGERLVKARKFNIYKNENQQAMCEDLQLQIKQVLQNFQVKGSELNDIEQAMKESIQDNINNQINKVNNEKIRQFKIQYPGKHNNLNQTKTQQQNIDLLGDDTLNLDENIQKIQKTSVQMNKVQLDCNQNNNQIQNDNNLIDLLGEISLQNDKQQAIQQQQNIQIYPNQGVSKQIQNKISNSDSNNNELDDLFGDMDIHQSSEKKKIQNNNTQQKEKDYVKNKQQNQEDDDDFFSSIANRK